MVIKIKTYLKNNLSILIHTIRNLVEYHISQARIRNLLEENRELYIEVGSGNKKGKNGWTTIDITKNCDIFWDLRKGIPFPDKSVNKIYSSHFFEHLTFKEGQAFLNECLRVLIPGGIFSICVPNARIYIEAYLKSETLDRKCFFGYKPAYNNTTTIDYINYTAYMDGHHKYMFDEENLIYILKDKGFRNVHLRQFDPDLDSESRRFESIYAQAEK